MPLTQHVHAGVPVPPESSSEPPGQRSTAGPAPLLTPALNKLQTPPAEPYSYASHPCTGEHLAWRSRAQPGRRGQGTRWAPGRTAVRGHVRVRGCVLRSGPAPCGGRTAVNRHGDRWRAKPQGHGTNGAADISCAAHCAQGAVAAGQTHAAAPHTGTRTGQGDREHSKNPGRAHRAGLLRLDAVLAGERRRGSAVRHHATPLVGNACERRCT